MAEIRMFNTVKEFCKIAKRLPLYQPLETLEGNKEKYPWTL